MATDGVEVDHPMKVRAFVHINSRRGRVAFYKGRQGNRYGPCIGAFDLETLRALDVAIPVAIAALVNLMSDAGLEPG